MIDIYVMLIRKRLKTIESVPLDIREAVREKIIKYDSRIGGLDGKLDADDDSYWLFYNCVFRFLGIYDETIRKK